MISGASNRVHLRVAALSDLVLMKAHALKGRDKPKDVYDLCYCLDAYPGGISRTCSRLARTMRRSNRYGRHSISFGRSLRRWINTARNN